MRTKKGKPYLKNIQLPNLAKNNETLCWDCAKALNRGCSWSADSEPVEGWKAKKTSRGYCVRSCPEFERCSWCFGRCRTAEDYISALESALVSRTESLGGARKNLRTLKEQNTCLEWQLTVHMGE